MTNTVDTLNIKREALVKQLAKVDTAIAQAGFVDSLAAGAYVYGKLNDGTEYSHARLLGVQKAEGTSGAWYKLRLNEDTAEETVKSVRLGNIDGVEGSADAQPTPVDAASETETPKAPKGKKDSANEI